MQNRPTLQTQERHCIATWMPTAMCAILLPLREVWSGYCARRELKRIAKLDDRLLSDIGVTRGDVNAALSARWNEDGVRQLCDLREERRRARRNLQQSGCGLVSRADQTSTDRPA